MTTSNNIISSQLYEQDFELWVKKTITKLENRDFNGLDIDNLIEELIELGKSEKRTLEGNLIILLAYLLKLKVQFNAPETMNNSWYNSVDEHRQRVKKNLRDTPSLKSYFTTAINNSYNDARKLALKEAQRAKFGVKKPSENEYPTTCPFSLAQIMDEDFYG